MSSFLKNKIDEIINKRQPLVMQIERVETQLTELNSYLQEIDCYRNLDEQLKNERLQALNIDHLTQAISVIQHDMQQLKIRFTRNTLNLGVVGRARQGKSRLLRSITGLNQAEIPDGNSTHCTGVRSTIRHIPNITPYAEAYFYSEDEFLQQIIKPYFTELVLGKAPTTLEQLASIKLPTLAKAGAEANAKFEHLKKYITHLDKYRNFLHEPSPKRIMREQIPEFVAQHNINDSSQPYFNYLAVKDVHIFCSFPNADVAQIAVIDMPGLGDTGIGDEDRLIATLGQDIDIVLFARMPKSTGDYWADVDIKLYDTAFKALPDIPLEKWSFQIINQLEDYSNKKQCEDLLRTMTDKHIHVVDTIITNCADTQDAYDKVLMPILEYMSTHITILDERFTLAKQIKLEQLRQDVLHFFAQIGEELNINSQPNDHEHKIFRPKFDHFWILLTSAVSKLTTELNEKSKRGKDENFEESLKEAINQAKLNTGIPNLSDIEFFIINKGSAANAFPDLLNTVRTTLTSHLQSLDTCLVATVEDAKNQVVQSLRDAGLAPLSNKTDIGFLHHMVKLTCDNEGYRTLHESFSNLANFNLLYRGFAQHRIHHHLDFLSADNDIAKDYKPTPEGVEEKLKLLHRMTLEPIEQSLSELLWEPSTAIFAVVEEFQGRILRADKVKSYEWENLLMDHCAEIWATDSDFVWHKLLNQISNACQIDRLSLTVHA
ncbi:MAG: hypothetical protein RI893_468 [Pseudomonadota bacterium]|jgi:hypothetical protein